jgi:hypothetical protein
MSSSHCLLYRMGLMVPATERSIHAEAHCAVQPGLDGGHLLLLGGHGGRVREVGMWHQWLVRWSVRNLVKMLSVVPGSGLPACGPDCRKSSHTSQSSMLSSSLRRPHLLGGWRVPASSACAQSAAQPYPYPRRPVSMVR